MSSLLVALVVAGVFAVAAYVLGMVSRGGALGGFLIGVAVYLSLGPQGFAVLALFVSGGSALTRIGYRSKEHSGVAEAHEGRRGARNALANCGVALLCAVSAALVPLEDLAASLAAAFVASLGAAFADTAESEVGQLSRGAPRLITSLRTVPPGTDGAVSALGTLAGIAAAALTALLGYGLGLVVGSTGATLLVALAAFLGTLADSLLGALAPRLGNEFTNVLCTLVAAALVVAFS